MRQFSGREQTLMNDEAQRLHQSTTSRQEETFVTRFGLLH